MKTALVLSAGGMFGAYQAGAWRALERVFRPDMVIGASAGALNGWAIAGGISADELAESWLDPRTAALMRPRFPLRPWEGIFDSKPLAEKARELVERFTPAVPFAAAVVELPALRLGLLRGENMTWRHLMAACAVPCGFPPVRLDGRLCVDGGLLSVLPLWAAGELGAGRVIAVNALPWMPSRLMRAAVGVVRRLRPPPPAPDLEVRLVCPERPLGSLRDAIRWDAAKASEWIRLGEHDVELMLCRSIGSIA